MAFKNDRQRKAVMAKMRGAPPQRKTYTGKPYSNEEEKAEWNAFNFAITKTKQYETYRDKGDRPKTARNKAMRELGIKADPKKYPHRKWFDLQYLPPKLETVAYRYKRKIYRKPKNK